MFWLGKRCQLNCDGPRVIRYILVSVLQKWGGVEVDAGWRCSSAGGVLASHMRCGVHTYNPNSREIEAGGLIIQFYSQLHRKFQGSLSYKRPCLKTHTHSSTHTHKQRGCVTSGFSWLWGSLPHSQRIDLKKKRLRLTQIWKKHKSKNISFAAHLIWIKEGYSVKVDGRPQVKVLKGLDCYLGLPCMLLRRRERWLLRGIVQMALYFEL